jgi:tetratricopeptide (TPR) repeat protein
MKESDEKSIKKPPKLPPNGPPLRPPEIILDTLKVPDETILLVPDTDDFIDPPHFVKAGQQRNWFDPYFYHCLPLVVGNQYGFLMLTTYDFVCRWDGRNGIEGVDIHILEPIIHPNYVTLESHFGSGILTIQSRYVFRTPKNVNLIVKEPPNYPIHGFSWMNAVVETDNLRRDFTFNIKITQPHLDIYVPKNTPIGCLLPYPRYFLDGYNMSELKDSEELQKSQRTIEYFSKERDDFDQSPRHRYMEGIDIYDVEFEHHQKTLDHGKWWFSKRKKRPSAGDLDRQGNGNGWLLDGIMNTFKKFFVVANAAIEGQADSPTVREEPASEIDNDAGQTPSTGPADAVFPLHGKKVRAESGAAPTAARMSQMQPETVPLHEDKTPSSGGKCPVNHGQFAAPQKQSHSETESTKSIFALRPEDYPNIMELNAELPEAAITLYLPSFYDKSLAPVKAERLRGWFEQDSKTKDHARFCLPLTMGAGIGYYILSPATFTISWDGDVTHDAEVEILDACTHADIDTHSSHGSFTIQSQFVPRTKKPGDFVFIKGVANQDRLPYHFLEAMLEAWWSPANFGLVGILNQPGKFTIKKGDPVAQMFAINLEQATYELAFKEGYPAQWQEWDDKRRSPLYTGKNLDYLKGLWPDESPVCPHFKSWSPAALSSGLSLDAGDEPQAAEEPVSIANLVRSARKELSNNNLGEAERLLNRAVALAEKEEKIGVDLVYTMVGLTSVYMRQSNFAKVIPILSQSLILCRRISNIDPWHLTGILSDLAYAERSLRLFPEAEEHYKEALDIKLETNRDQIEIASSMFDLGSLYDQMGKFEESEPLLLESLEMRKQKLGEKHADTLFTLNGLACLYTHLKRFDEAAELFDSVIASRSEVLGNDSLDVADSYNDLGFLHLATDDFNKAEEAFNKAVAIRKDKLLGEDDLLVAEFLNNLAFLYRDHNKLEKAKEYFQKVLDIKEKILPKNDPLIGGALEDLAHIHVALGDNAKAQEYFKKAKLSS